MDETTAAEFRAFLELKNKSEETETERIKMLAENDSLKEVNAGLTNRLAVLEVKLACQDETLKVYRHFTGINAEE